MIVAVHQPNYLPYLGFFHKMMRSDVFVLYDTAQYSKNEFHNRNRIKTPSGPQWLTVPVRHPSGKRIVDVAIDSGRPWAKAHLNALQANYARAPWRDSLLPEVAGVLRAHSDRLVELNTKLIGLLKTWLGLETKIVASSDLDAANDLTATEKVIFLVRAVGGTVYLSGPGGKDYLDESRFSNVQLEYDEFRHPTYPQPFGSFVPNLSAIDALLNCGPEDTRALLEESTAPPAAEV